MMQLSHASALFNPITATGSITGLVPAEGAPAAAVGRVPRLPRRPGALRRRRRGLRARLRFLHLPDRQPGLLGAVLRHPGDEPPGALPRQHAQVRESILNFSPFSFHFLANP